MSAHVGINSNDASDKLVEKARDLNNNITSLITLDDANAIAHYRIKEKNMRVYQQTFEIDANREITKTVTKFRSGH